MAKGNSVELWFTERIEKLDDKKPVVGQLKRMLLMSKKAEDTGEESNRDVVEAEEVSSTALREGKLVAYLHPLILLDSNMFLPPPSLQKET